jgi:predicted RNA-binding protein YlxR (DUF448 family)
MSGSVPERTCVGCRERAPKRVFVRIVRAPAGTAKLDPAGAAPGRGAYVHPSAACARAALTGNRLARALRASLAPDEAVRLLNEIERREGE